MKDFIEFEENGMRTYGTGTPRKLRVYGTMRSMRDFNWIVTEQPTSQTSDSFIGFKTRKGAHYSWKRIGDGPRGHLITTRCVFGKWKTIYLSDDAYIEEV